MRPCHCPTFFKFDTCSMRCLYCPRYEFRQQSLSRNYNPSCQKRQSDCDCRRRTGNAGRYGHQAERPKNPARLQRPRSCGICRRDGRRVCPFFQARSEAGAVSGQPEPRGGGACTGMAHGPGFASSGSVSAGNGRQIRFTCFPEPEMLSNRTTECWRWDRAAFMRLPRRARCCATQSCRPRKIAQEALKIASEICVFTNSEIIVEEL